MRLALLALSVFAALPALADTADRSWSGSAEFGLAIASGNADSTQVNGKLAFEREMDHWLYSLNAAALRAEADDQVSASRYDAGLKFGYKFTPSTYLFGALRHERDDFAAYEWQSIASVGFGWQAIDSDTTELTLEGGPGLRRVQPIDILTGTPPVATSMDVESDMVLRGTVDFSHALTANTQIGNQLLVESGGGSTFAQNDLGLSVRMSERYALKAGYQLRHTTEVPVGVEKTDRLFTTNLVVGF